MAKQMNKYLTFLLEEEVYAISILKIKEIIGMMDITELARMPEYVKGVINLRGKIIPIIDLRLRLGMGEREYDEKTSIIVVETQTDDEIKMSGVVVDAVQEVLDIDPDQFEKPPQYGVNSEHMFLSGMGKVKDKVIMTLDSDKIIASNEMEIQG